VAGAASADAVAGAASADAVAGAASAVFDTHRMVRCILHCILYFRLR